MSESIAAPYRNVAGQLDQVGRMIGGASGPLDLRRPEVSGWSVGEHLDHVLKVKHAILGSLVTTPAKPLRPISMLGRVVLFTGFIPRGKGRSPEPLRGAEATAPELEAALARCREALDAVARAEGLMSSAALLMRHPVFGGLTPRQAIRFSEIHTQHHFKILRDMSRGQ